MRTLLIVEDDEAIRGSLSEGLGMAGYRVTAVPTSTEALPELKSDHPIDLAIIDIKMPSGHPQGFALGRMARFHRPGLPLIFISGHPDLAEADEPPKGTQVLLKPVRLQKLLRTIETEIEAEIASSIAVSKPSMAIYRIYFRNQHRFLVGRDEFEAGDDAHAVAIARALCDACSDVSTSFELWQGTKQVEMASSPRSPDLNFDEIVARVQNTVLERELVLQNTHWVIAESRRLLEQTQRLLDGTRRRAP